MPISILASIAKEQDLTRKSLNRDISVQNIFRISQVVFFFLLQHNIGRLFSLVLLYELFVVWQR